jgi:hypothetical protein
LNKHENGEASLENSRESGAISFGKNVEKWQNINLAKYDDFLLNLKSRVKFLDNAYWKGERNVLKLFFNIPQSQTATDFSRKPLSLNRCKINDTLNKLHCFVYHILM